jgi:hypothetical protein
MRDSSLDDAFHELGALTVVKRRHLTKIEHQRREIHSLRNQNKQLKGTVGALRRQLNQQENGDSD